MTSIVSRLRFGALLAAGALSVHELRFLTGFGRHADGAPAEQGHAYLSRLLPVVVLVGMVVLAGHLLRLGAGRRAESSPPRLRTVWAVASVLLAVIYVGQETAESWLTAGHPGGLEGVLGHGGWSALVFAAAVGALIAVASRGAEESVTVAPPAAWRVRLPSCVAVVLVSAGPAWPRSPLARFLAGRGPPPPS